MRINHIKHSETRRKARSILLGMISMIILATAGATIFSHPGLVEASSTLTFVPVADSYVNQSDPSYNFGDDNSIQVDSSPLVRSYLRFNVNGIGGARSPKSL